MEFIPGIELSRRFYAEAVGPILRRGLPGLRHTAALVGYGSEVLDSTHRAPPTTTGDRGCCCSPKTAAR
jgi:hypothetical protein